MRISRLRLHDFRGWADLDLRPRTHMLLAGVPRAGRSDISRKTGELVIQDGPFADTKEQLGGSFVIEVPDLDAAIAWAERAPSALYGDVEIRPTATRFVDGAWTDWTFPGT